MWGSSFWGLLGFSVTFGLAVLSHTPEQMWLRPWLIGASITCGILSAIVLCWPLRHHNNRLRVREAFRHPRRWIANTVEAHLIPIGLVVIIFGVMIVGIGIWRQPSATPFTIGISAIGDPNAPIGGSVANIPTPKKITSYEKDQRLRAVDEIYNVFATQLSPAYAEGRALLNGLLPAIGDGTADQKLNDHAKTVETAFNNLSALLKKYEYFPDIVQVTQQKPVFNGLAETNASRNLIGTIALLKQAVQPSYVSQMLDRDVTLLEARNASRDFDQYLKNTVPRLQQKRAEIEAAEIVGSK
jgi:hypothetical protein